MPFKASGALGKDKNRGLISPGSVFFSNHEFQCSAARDFESAEDSAGFAGVGVAVKSKEGNEFVA